MKNQRSINGWMHSIKCVMGSKHFVIVGVLGCLIPMAVYAASGPSPIVNGLYNFVAGTVINPDEVNANFDYFANAITVKSGNVGIGTTDPLAPFHVQGHGGSQSQAIFVTTDYVHHVSGSGLSLGNGVSRGNGYSFIQASANGGDSAENLVLQQYGGNVGIGTTDPSSKLTGSSGLAIYHANLPGLSLSNSGKTWLMYGTGTDLRLYGGGERVTFQGDGNVGIGTTTPASRLAVAGLPSAPPDGSGTRGIVCITNAGNMWVDEDGVGDCS